MFYKLIKKKSDEWYSSGECTVNDLIDYMINKGELRDAQIEAIKVYLYLKIKCQNKKLFDLIKEGYFYDENILSKIELNDKQRKIFENNNIALTLLTYIDNVNNDDKIEKKELEKLLDSIKGNCETIDFENELVNVLDDKYPEYVYSLPMGAGKTYLMACFIYLDLYFALNEHSNDIFARNFVVIAPSGLKNSIIPSLKTMENFDPTFVLPEESAKKVKSILHYEILDQNRSDSKSNKVDNPNVQKIISNGRVEDNFGLVLIINAEKLIIKHNDLLPTEELLLKLNSTEDEFERRKAKEEYEIANELRSIISRIPQKAIFVDEIHHVKTDEIKARQVINYWAEKGEVNSVHGFSGTPYLSDSKEFCLVKTNEISQIVYYYPLADGIDNFLKRPEIVVIDIDEDDKEKNRVKIIKKGIKLFFDEYGDKVYKNNITAKLAIYSSNIENLNSETYPIVLKEIKKYGLSSDNILRFYGTSKDKEYKLESDAEYKFLTLDRPENNIRVVLLCQIGKEGWDCKSLTGIILAQENKGSSKISILQTSCRTLRKVEKEGEETALIVLNKANAEMLKNELDKEHHIDINTFQKGTGNKNKLKFYDRTNILKLPSIKYMDLEIDTKIEMIEEIDTEESIKEVCNTNFDVNEITKRYENYKSFDEEDEKKISTAKSEKDSSLSITYEEFLNDLVKESFNMITYNDLKDYDKYLNDIFLKITYEKQDNKSVRYANEMINIDKVKKRIRLAFSNRYKITQNEESIPKEAKLLHIENFISEKPVSDKDKYFPDENKVETIIKSDKTKIELEMSKEQKKIIKMLNKVGKFNEAKKLEAEFNDDSQISELKNRTYHYIPYKSDSRFEVTVYNEIIKLDCIKNKGLEVYFNGDDNLTEFKIKCYSLDENGHKKYIGFYVPDFLVIKRKDNQIYKVLIVETKGEIYAHDPKFKLKKCWTENNFKELNNKKYNKYEYLYVEETLKDNERIELVTNKINEFFEEE